MAPMYCYHEKLVEQELARFLCNTATMNNLIEDLEFWHGQAKKDKIERFLQHLESPGIHEYYLTREEAKAQEERILRLKANLERLSGMVDNSRDRNFVCQFTRCVMRSVYH